jgi:WD40 repeat protein
MTKHTILFLAVNLRGTDQGALDPQAKRDALDQEASAIRKVLKRSGYRDRFELVTRWAAEPHDLLRELRELKPTVVHFSGHGGQDGLFFQAPNGDARVVSPAAIAETFGAAGGSVKLVVLSACYSEAPAEALLAHVDCVVAMSGVLRDDMARAFAIGFYGALGDQESVAAAYRHGNAAISLDGLSDADRPQLKICVGADAARMILAAVAPAVHVALPCPYPGMRSYSADDSDHFYGRGVEIDELLGRLRAGEREIYVIGPSGSGKSSLVAAGVLPRLACGVAGLGLFVVRSMRPGEHPAARLGELLEVSDRDLTAPVDVIAALLTGRALSSSVLILIDQLEELFTLADADERDRFLIALEALRAAPRCVVVFTLRADFFGAFMESSLWTGRRGRPSRIEVDPMRDEALNEAIVRPARDLGVSVEPELIERLLADAGSEPGILPLLQETLVQLWDRRQGQTLTLADYEALGDRDRSGLAIALSRRADALLRDLTRAQETIARRILLRLISFGEGRSDTGRQQPRSKLRAADDDAADFEIVLRRLIADRLLTADEDDLGGEAHVDLAHEVMITAWPTLAGWILAHRVDEQRRRQFEAAAAQWVERGRGARGLLDLIELADAEAWQRTESARDLGQSVDVAALVAASRAAHDKQRRQLRGLVWSAFAALAVFAAVVTTLAVIARHRASEAEASRRQAEADSKRAEASDHESQSLLAQSYKEAGWQQLLGGHPQEAMPYLMAARRSGEKGELLRMLIGTATRFLPLVPILEHGAAVSSAAFSSDGSRVVTASSDRTARVWDAATGKPLGPSFRHQEGVNSAAFNRDGSRVVTASSDRTARVWDAVTGKPLGPPLQHQGAVWKAAFSPDGSRVVTASDDKTARIWDASTGKPIGVLLQHQGVVWSVAFSPDGTRVITASWDKTARVWDANTGTPLTAALEHQDRVSSAAFSPDGARVVTAGWDATARVWDAATGKPLAIPLQHQLVVRSAVFSPDGTRIVTASSDRTAQIWDAATGKPLGPRLTHPGSVWSAAFSPDGTHVVTASWDKTARVWDAATGKPIGTPLEHQGAVNSAAFSSDGNCVVTASLDHTARIWDAGTGKPATALEHRGGVNRVAFSRDGTRVVTASLDHTARIWDVATGKPLSPPLEHQGWVWSAELSPDGSRVVTASLDRTARVWDAASGKPLVTLLAHQGGVNRAAFNLDGSRVVTASLDRTARVWDAASGKPLGSPIEHQAPVWSAEFSPDGTRVVTASDDHTARVWDIATSKPVAPPLEHQGSVRTAEFSPDGTRVVTASLDHTARIWDAASGRPLTSPLAHQGGVWSATFSPDGTHVVTTSLDNTARVWDAATGQPVATWLEHQGAVNSAAFSRDGTRIVTTSDDNTARVWDATTGRPLVPPFQHQAAVYSAAFSPDGMRIITASDDNTARIWETPLDETAPAEWSILAARSPFVLSGTVHVRRVPEPALDSARSAPTISASTPGASRSTIAESIPQPLERRAEPIPFAPGQIWSGHYVCAQGRTSLALQITSVRDNTVDAVFAFSHAESGAFGSHLASGQYDPTYRRLTLASLRWIRQPPGYTMVDLTGTLSADGSRFAGSVSTGGCSTFSVRHR